MSRAALWRQEGNARERERQAEELYQTVVAEGRERAARSKSIVPLWGPDNDSFHWNPLLLKNTIHSPYFQKCCKNLSDWNAVVDEIYYEVKHVQPFAVASHKTPSTAFCLLLRMLALRMTDHQMDLTLKHADSPYIRAIGFLYLRYAGTPEQIINWIQPYLYDDEPLVVEAGHGAPSTTIGQFVRDLFRSRDFHGTPLPRFPNEVERAIQVLLLQAEKVSERALLHAKNAQRMSYFQALGNEVMALYGDDENPITWYKAVIDRVITRDDVTGASLVHPKFVVTFPEYGNTETVLLGELDMINGGSWRHEDASSSRGSNRDYDRHQGRDRPGTSSRGRRDGDLYDEVRRHERDSATSSSGRAGWARRPPTTKNALSVQAARPKHSVNDDSSNPTSRRRPFDSEHGHGGTTGMDNADRTSRQKPHGNHQESQSNGRTERKRSAEEMAAIQEKKRNLMARYG